MTSQPHYNRMAEWVMEALVDNFQPAANLYFEDTGPCPENATGVVKVHDICPMGVCPPNSTPNAWWVGYYPGEDNLYVSLSYTWLAPNAAERQRLILHEFAHVLGFAHEFHRPDFTQPCDGYPDPLPGLTTYGTADANSVTANGYCHSNVGLSAGDVDALRRTDVYNTPGAQRMLALVRDSGYDSNANWWTGSGWSWSELSTKNVAAPASVVATRVGDRHQVHAFWKTTGSQLHVNWWNGSAWSAQTWTDKSISSSPSAVSYRYYGDGPQGSFAESPVGMDVFAIDSVGKLASSHWSGTSWSWVNYGSPQGVSLTNASAVNFRDFGEADERFYVFSRSSGGKLYLAYGVGNQLTWTGDLGSPTDGQVSSYSTAISYRDAGARRIFFWTTSNDKLWTYHWNGTSWSWADQGKPAQNVGVLGPITASTWTVDGYRRQSVYVAGTDGTLWERHWNGAAWSWVSHAKPSGVGTVYGPSATVYRIPGTPALPTQATPVSIARHIFVRGDDGKLYVRWTADSGANWAWATQSAEGDPSLLDGQVAAVAYWSN